MKLNLKDFLSARIALAHPAIGKTLASGELGEFAFNTYELPRRMGEAKGYSREAAQHVIRIRREVCATLDKAIDSVIKAFSGEDHEKL